MHQIVNKIIAVLLALAPLSTFALSTDATRPYHIHSDSMIYNRTKHTTTYIGHVVATQGSTRVTGDRLVISTDPKTNAIKSLIAYGQLAHYSTLPNNKKQKLFARANIIKYWPKRNKTELINNAYVTQAKNVFSGRVIFYDIKNQTVYTKATKVPSRTSIVIQPVSQSHT